MPNMILNEDETFVADILDEVDNATKQHGNFASAHEMYAVLQEEVDEVWEIVKQKHSNRNRNDLYKELVQVAAMAIKAIKSMDKFVDKPIPRKLAP